jgi:hypothetical protein
MILGSAWIMAVAFGLAIWRRLPLSSSALGAAALAVLVDLTAAGGISFPAVSLALWLPLALGMNLRGDRPCASLRTVGHRIPAFVLAALWAALVGTFVGTVGPHWRANAALADANDALRARPPEVNRAEAAYERAKVADPLSQRPWLGLAALDYQVWNERGAKPDDRRWWKIPIELFKANEPPRPPDSWARHRDRAMMTSLLLKQAGSSLPPLKVTQYRADVVHASRTAARLYPTNPMLRARLAEASAEIGMMPDALKEGRAALELDGKTPHEDKKLEPSVRRWLQDRIPEWQKAVDEAGGIARPKPNESKPQN